MCSEINPKIGALHSDKGPTCAHAIGRTAAGNGVRDELECTAVCAVVNSISAHLNYRCAENVIVCSDTHYLPIAQLRSSGRCHDRCLIKLAGDQMQNAVPREEVLAL
jgi:hypothetical protein